MGDVVMMYLGPAIMTALGAIVLWSMKRFVALSDAKFKLISDQLAMFSDRFSTKDREDDKRDNRLSGGQDAFNDIRDTLKRTNKLIEDFQSRFVSTGDFDAFCKEHKADHDTLERKVGKLHRRFSETDETVRSVVARVEGALNAITDIVARTHPEVGSKEDGP